MHEYWEGYMKPLEGNKAMIAFNAGVSDYVPDEEYPYMAFMKVKLNTPKEDGLVDEEESDDIGFIEDRLEMESLRYKAGQYIGRIITKGEVNFIYYLKLDFEWKNIVDDTMAYFKNYKFEFGSKMDMEWEIYTKLLFPTLREWQLITNRHACAQLQEEGDTLQAKRAIEHTIYFNTSEDKESFKKLMEVEGFKTLKEIELTDKLVKFGLKFYRVDAPDYYNIDAITMKIIDMSEKSQGQYDGWETSLVK
ncbi:DUF695 domain-containing protein [Sulfurimonas sp.]|uniref:DUF695 domain-containing protein n=1 Tax=Sulfurimonas sp. TaxID=2022749 RepID=UPI00260F14F0|nr:DUF695 domain-containing protein [Sulfurimonas sp.]